LKEEKAVRRFYLIKEGIGGVKLEISNPPNGDRVVPCRKLRESEYWGVMV